MSHSIWLCNKRIIFFCTSQIFHFWNKVCEKKGIFFVSLCITLPYRPHGFHRMRTRIVTQQGKVFTITCPFHFLSCQFLHWPFLQGFFLNIKTNARRFRPHLSPDKMLPSLTKSLFSVYSWGFFRSFPSTVRQMSKKRRPHPSSDTIGHHNHQMSFHYGRQWPLMLTRPNTHMDFIISRVGYFWC